MQAVLKDIDSSPLSAAEKVLMHFVARVNADAHNLRFEDMEKVRQAGWTDEALYDALTVCALFNFYNRWIDASGVHALSDEEHRISAKRTAEHGYARTASK